MALRRILVVDDDRDLVESMSAVLDEAGHVVMVAVDGESALSVCRGAGPGGGRPDVVLVDLHLAAGTLAGSALLEALRKATGGAAPLVLVSGEPGLREHAEALGADGALEKPFSIEALLALLDRFAPGAEPPPPPP